MLCEDCHKEKDLTSLIRTFDNYKGVYHCVDCHVKALDGFLYPASYPLDRNISHKERHKLRKLLRWALG
jgi:hypothetical protein